MWRWNHVKSMKKKTGKGGGTCSSRMKTQWWEGLKLINLQFIWATLCTSECTLEIILQCSNQSTPNVFWIIFQPYIWSFIPSAKQVICLSVCLFAWLWKKKKKTSKTYKQILLKFSGNVDRRPRNSYLNFWWHSWFRIRSSNVHRPRSKGKLGCFTKQPCIATTLYYTTGLSHNI